MKNRKKGTDSLHFLELISTRGGRLVTMGGGVTNSDPQLLCLYLWNQKQQSGIRSSEFGEQGPFCPPWHLQALCNCSRNICTDAHHVAEG